MLLKAWKWHNMRLIEFFISSNIFSMKKKKSNKVIEAQKKKLKIWIDEFFFLSSNLKNQTWLNKIIKQHQLIHKAKKKHKKIELDGKTKWVMKNLKPGFWKWIERGGWCPFGFCFLVIRTKHAKEKERSFFCYKWLSERDLLRRHTD